MRKNYLYKMNNHEKMKNKINKRNYNKIWLSNNNNK